MRDSKLITAAVLLAIFVAGGICGAAAARLLASPPASTAATEASGPDSPETDRPGRTEVRKDGDGDEDRRRSPVYRIVSFLNEELELTPRQQERIEAIMDDRRERAHEIFGEMRSRFRSQLDSTVTELKGVLTEEQVPRLEALLEEMRERHEKHERERRERDDRGDAPG